jgi:hypothetical protein
MRLFFSITYFFLLFTAFGQIKKVKEVITKDDAVLSFTLKSGDGDFRIQKEDNKPEWTLLENGKMNGSIRLFYTDSVGFVFYMTKDTVHLVMSGFTDPDNYIFKSHDPRLYQLTELNTGLKMYVHTWEPDCMSFFAMNYSPDNEVEEFFSEIESKCEKHNWKIMSKLEKKSEHFDIAQAFIAINAMYFRTKKWTKSQVREAPKYSTEW